VSIYIQAPIEFHTIGVGLGFRVGLEWKQTSATICICAESFLIISAQYSYSSTVYMFAPFVYTHSTGQSKKCLML